MLCHDVAHYFNHAWNKNVQTNSNVHLWQLFYCISLAPPTPDTTPQKNETRDQLQLPESPKVNVFPSLSTLFVLYLLVILIFFRHGQDFPQIQKMLDKLPHLKKKQKKYAMFLELFYLFIDSPWWQYWPNCCPQNK